DLSRLFNFEVLQADAFSPLQSLHSDTDAHAQSPGPALNVDRVFPNSIHARYLIGPFGRGWEWVDGWQRVLSVSANGTAIRTAADGSQRYFQPDGRGGYFADPGDEGILTSIGGGSFTLTESNGTVTGFSPDGKVAYVEDTNGNRITAVYSNGVLTTLVA